MVLPLTQLLGGTDKLWSNYLSKKRPNTHLFFDNLTLLAAASFFMLASSISGSVLHNGPGKPAQIVHKLTCDKIKTPKFIVLLRL
jgi:hypothetical protein